MFDRRSTGSRSIARTLLVLLVLLIAAFAASLSTAHAAGKHVNGVVASQLTSVDEYIDPAELASNHARSGDNHRLESAIQAASSKGVSAKIGIVSTYPHHFSSPAEAAASLRNFIDFSGVLILATPKGLGINSDYLSVADTNRIAAQAQPRCAVSYTDCAILALNKTVPRIQAAQSRANRDVAVFWGVCVLIFGIIIAALVLWARRRQQEVIGRWREERAAGE